MADPDSTFLDTTIGVIFVGFLFTGCLFGVTSAQSIWYFRHYQTDRRILKLLVTVVWILDAVHLGLYTATMFIYLIQKKAAYFGQERLPWTSNVQLLCNAFAIGLIQSFYASRIWTLSRQKILLVVMVIFIAATWAASIVLFIETILTRMVAQYVLLAPFDIALSALSASTDVLLCGALVVLLSRSRTGTAGANRLINKLVLFTVETGFLTSIYAILSVIMVVVLPMTSLFVMFYYIGARLYTVSLLATLNARASLRVEAEKMGHRSLPDLEATAPRGLASTPTGIPVVIPSIQTSSTSDDSVSGTAGSRVYCDGGRCYLMPSGSALSLTPDTYIVHPASGMSMETTDQTLKHEQ
ncbi:hypothetical protein PYCCODRAFT_1474622 [Trametes coccinea BRFM310]|uniref:DUF6534 domain-containing protein n=1 Tax=Trametes coccinea (strain BRFM310) TaxID=1353009 RepID=A0A1Y2IZC3_TRAC3|nr:hypothetical protein PYCCODRAFT_1474622 [Trametes coccinea BRFM310]